MTTDIEHVADDAADQLTAATVHTLASGRVHRITGPPGTGKTTRLAKDVAETARIRGGSDIVIVSFTTTAAENIRGAAARAAADNPAARIPSRNVSTLHSLGRRAIGSPDVALDAKHIADWNLRTRWPITPNARGGDQAIDNGLTGAAATDDVSAASSGDELLAAMDLRRAMLVPSHEWPPDLIAFARRWTDWKNANGFADFADMISEALQRALDGEAAPGQPRVIVADEAQDFTPAEFALALAWGRHPTCDSVAFAGDDDQTILDFRGASADPFVGLGLDADMRPRVDDGLDLREDFLQESRRIPAAVHAVAVDWISRITEPRIDKDYHPRAARGSIDCTPLGIGDPRLVDRLAADTAAGRTVMVIATCGYMLAPLIANLRREGLPFHNPYRPAEAKWNPLGPASTGMSTAERLFRYLVADERELGEESRLWTGDDVRAWSQLVGQRASGFRPRVADRIAALPSGEVPWPLIADLFRDEELRDLAVTPSLDWLLDSALARYKEPLKYPATVVRKQGVAALAHQPMITVGTVHSVKGGEADSVYVDPTLSTAGMAQWTQRGRPRSSIVRVLYVALTRALERVTVLYPTSHHTVPRNALVPEDLRVPHVA